MTKDEIGAFAGPIYEALKNGETLTLTELQKKSELKKEDFFMGLGWLFCEDKLYTITEEVKKKQVEKIGWK